MITTQVLKISLCLSAIGVGILLSWSIWAAKELNKKDEKILIQSKEIERLNKEVENCVASLHTCEVMLHGYTKKDRG